MCYARLSLEQKKMILFGVKSLINEAMELLYPTARLSNAIYHSSIPRAYSSPLFQFLPSGKYMKESSAYKSKSRGFLSKG